MDTENKKKIALTGITPSGRVHIGNYFGAMKPIIDMANDFDTYIFLSDFHSLMSIQEGNNLREAIYNLVLDYLAIGLDPEKVLFYRQSDIPEVTELTWIFNCIMTVPWLERAHAFKDKTAKGIIPTVGLFDYPVLMAADILLPQAEIIPVGKDQIQHVEMARDVARRFNQIYGDVFVEPIAKIQEEVAIVPGTDGQKMSKSYGNTIPLFGTDAEIKRAIMSILTDSKDPQDPKNPDDCNVFALHKLITPEPKLSEIRDGYKKGGLGYGDSKKILLENYLAFIAPMRERREYFASNPDLVEKILLDGAQKIRLKIEPIMRDVREKVGLVLKN